MPGEVRDWHHDPANQQGGLEAKPYSAVTYAKMADCALLQSAYELITVWRSDLGAPMVAEMLDFLAGPRGGAPMRREPEAG